MRLGLLPTPLAAPLLLVDVDDGAGVRGVVADLEARPEVKHVSSFCRNAPSDPDGMPPTAECAPYDLLFLLTPVVTPQELATFEERLRIDPRVDSYRLVPPDETSGRTAPQFEVELSSDPGTGEPPPDQTAVREDIGRLHGTGFVLERPRCREDRTP